jgi:spore coat polysaccharide biosynthesis protein SpsF
VLVADAAPAVGLGHVSRCSAVAVALAARGVPVRCLAHGAERELARDGVRWAPSADPTEARAGEPALVVFDGARIDPAVVSAAARELPVAVFSDGGPVPAGVALVISPIAPPPPGDALHGLEHACLRPAFWGLPRRTVRPAARRVLVTTGGGPDGDALGEALAEALPAAASELETTVVRGPFSRLRAPAGVALLDAPATLHDPLLAADLVVATAGQTSLEAAACGTPAVLVALDGPQADQGERLARAGAARLGAAGDPAGVARAAAALAADDAARAAMSAAGQAAVDGHGALRVAYRLAALRRPAAA